MNIPDPTLQSWRKTLDDGYEGRQKPRNACKIVRDAIDAAPAADPAPPIPPTPEPPPVNTTRIVVPPVTTLTAEFVSKWLKGEPVTLDSNGKPRGGIGLDIRSSNNHASVRTCNIKSERYGIYCDGKALEVLDTLIESGPSGDDYCLRGNVPSVTAKRCTFKNTGTKGVVRLYGDNSNGTNKYFEDCHFAGGKVMTGGGAQSEWENEQPSRWIQVRGTCKVQSFEVYDKDNCTCEGVDFSGTGHIFVDNGGTLTLKGCENVPTIKRKSIDGTTVEVIQ